MKTLKLTLLITLAIISTLSSAEAARWEYIGENQSCTVSIDTDSIKKGHGSSKEVWVRSETKPSACYPGKTGEKCVLTIVSYESLYAFNKTSCSLQSNTFYSNGSSDNFSIGSYLCEGEPYRKKIPPGSFGEMIFQKLFSNQ